MSGRHDPAARLARMILAHAAAAGVEARIVAVDRRDWASATFVGERQRIVLAASPGPARAAWLATLPEADIPLPRHCLVDLVPAASPEPGAIVLEALLIETD